MQSLPLARILDVTSPFLRHTANFIQMIQFSNSTGQDNIRVGRSLHSIKCQTGLDLTVAHASHLTICRLLEASGADASASKVERRDLSKRYSHWFVWGQLSGWFKQSVNDPAQSLSAERKGTLSLPDIESCYRGRQSNSYGEKVRGRLRSQTARAPSLGVCIRVGIRLINAAGWCADPPRG